MATYPSAPPLQRRFFTVMLSDVSTAGQIYFVPGFRGKIKKVSTALNGAITGADAGLTVKIDGAAVTGGTITIANSGSAAGDLDSCIPTGANTCTPTSVIELETDGASTNAVAVVATFEIEPV